MSKPDTIDEIFKPLRDDIADSYSGEYNKLETEARAALSAMVASNVIGKDAWCEKGHPEYYDWCSYCDVERIRSELRAEQRQRAIAKGVTL